MGMHFLGEITIGGPIPTEHLPELLRLLDHAGVLPDGELSGYQGPLAFGPRGPRDEVPDDPRVMVVFPEHHNGRTIPGVPAHPRDCPATRGMNRHHACQRCRRCWRPFEALSRKES